MAPAPKPMEARIEDAWHPARLIPTTGIGGQDEQEERATSSLLAVMRAVPEFGRALLEHLDAPAGRISTYSEVHFKDEDEKVSIPDGGIIVERGKMRWRCLVEVKTGNAPIRAEQIAGYLDLARAHDIDAVLTISNQITSSPEEPPVPVDPKKVRKVALRHLSWWHILTEAIDQHRHRGITDPDQAWLLGELIAYLDHEKSGASGFEDLGDKWVAVRDGARAQTLRAADAGVRDVAARWEQFVQYLALGLRQDLGREVVAVWPRKLDLAARRDFIVKDLADTGHLRATVKVPDAVAPVDIEGRPMDPSGSMWMPFIAHSLQFLALGGRLAFVLPYEATHVRYAKPIWTLLSESFGSIRVLRSRRRIFPDLLQDVVLVLASDRGSSTDALAYELYEDETSLCAAAPTRTVDIAIPRIISGERPFVEALLSPPVRALVSGPVPPWSTPLRGLATIRIGYVSGDKAFFHPDAEATAGFALSPESLKPAVSSGRQLRAAGLWTSGMRNERSKPLFLPPLGLLAAGDALYVREGERRGVSARYKCKVRTPWYVTPDVRIPDFVLPVFSERPQLVINDAQLVASNSLICGFLKSGSLVDIATAWYTSWTLLQVELGVHALGGGVLVLIPGELNRLNVASIPVDPTGTHWRALDVLLRANDILGAYELGDAHLRKVPTLRGVDLVDIRDAALDLAQWRTHTSSTVTSEAAA